jgi:hypothetical protein
VEKPFHAFKNGTMHDPTKHNPRLEIMISITHYEGCQSAEKEKDLWREVFVPDILSCLEERRVILLF